MSLRTTILTSLLGASTPVGELRSGTISTGLDRRVITLTDGSGANQASRIYGDSGTLAASASVTYDLYDFEGARDVEGNTFALSKVKALAIRNNATDANSILRVGGEGSGATFNSVNGSDTVRIADVAPGGELILAAPTAAGYQVADVSNHLLKLENLNNSASLDFDLVVVGA